MLVVTRALLRFYETVNGPFGRHTSHGLGPYCQAMEKQKEKERRTRGRRGDSEESEFQIPKEFQTEQVLCVNFEASLIF